MSASGREVAHRLFAAEYDEATYSYSESDEERAPNYVVTPTGARVNRLFFVGVLTEVEQVSDDVLRARVVDPTGAFVVYAGQYQPDEMAFLEDTEPPMFVAVTGKARTFSPDDSDRVFTSVRPESINEVDADTRDRWTVQAAEATLARVATFRAALDLGLTGDRLRTALGESGVSESLAAGIPVAIEQYGTTEHYLAAVADVALDALELVAGSADEVSIPSITPGDAGDGTVDAAAIAAGIDDAVVRLEAPASTEADVEEPGGPAGDGPTDEALEIEVSEDEASEDDAIEDEATADAPTDAGASEDTTSGTDGSAESSDVGGSAGAGETAETSETSDAVEAADTADQPADAEVPEADEQSDSADRSGDTEGAEAGGTEIDEAPSGADADGSTDEELGDFEPGGATADDEVSEDVLDEEERERIEEEYGTDFSTGSEVGEPGEAGIEPEAGPIEPEDAGADEPAAAGADEPSDPGADETGPATEAAPTGEESTGDDEAGAETTGDEPDDDEPTQDEGTEPADPGDVDLEAATLDAMDELDQGDGADREAVVAAVVDDLGVDPGAVEDAIQDALMAGKCYEPDDGSVKSI